MKTVEIKSSRLGDRYVKTTHNSGLDIYIYEKKGYSSIYAIYGTKFGSINTKFKVCDGEVKVPDGIAHYLEHKLFESEDGDAFSKYAKTGASANAYTSFDKTCYLFSCTENFEESLKILLELVNNPYFTEQTVKKEQGIISQEIKMYDDSPEWKVLVNLLGAMYHNHPVKADIAGTVESIRDITAEKLYQCYNSYYSPENMALCICGDVDVERTLEVIDPLIVCRKPVKVESIFPDEPKNIVKDRVEQKLEISIPMFMLGFKESFKLPLSARKIAQTKIILESLQSKSSRLYNRLLEKNLINQSFSCEYFEGPGYASVIFGGESRDPDEAARIIKEEIDVLHKNKMSEKEFNLAKRAVYGELVSSFDSTSDIANLLINSVFSGRELFNQIDEITNCSLDDVNERLNEQLDCKNSSLSIIFPV